MTTLKNYTETDIVSLYSQVMDSASSEYDKAYYQKEIIASRTLQGMGITLDAILSDTFGLK